MVVVVVHSRKLLDQEYGVGGALKLMHFAFTCFKSTSACGSQQGQHQPLPTEFKSTDTATGKPCTRCQAADAGHQLQRPAFPAVGTALSFGIGLTLGSTFHN